MKLASALGGVVALGAIGIGATIVYQMASAPPTLASRAPQDSVLYVEAPNLKSALDAFRASPAHKDFERSRSHKELSDNWGVLKTMADEGKGPLKHLKSLGLPLDEATSLRFLGQGVAFGLTAPKGGAPAGYAVARMDLEGLATDLAVKGDWKEVWGKLSALLQSKDGKSEDYKGYTIVARPIEEGSKFHAFYCQIDRFLIASTARGPVVSFIDVAAGEAEGLTKHAGWSATKQLDAGEDSLLAYAWVDPEFWRDGARVRESLIALSKTQPGNERATAELEKNLTGKELERLAAETKALKGLAIGLVAGGGSPYDLRLISSHEAKDVFTAEDKPLNPAAMAGADPSLYVSCAQPYSRINGFLNSKGWKTIAATEAVQWINAKLENPDQLKEHLAGDRSLEEALKHDPRFEALWTIAMTDLVAPELLGERWTLNVAAREGEIPEGQLPVSGAAAVTLRPALRGIAAVALGALEVHAEKVQATVREHAGTKIYTVKGPQGDVSFALVGPNLVASMSDKGLEAALAAGQGGEAAAKLKKLLDTVPEGCDFVSYYDTAGLMGAMERFEELNRRGPRMREIDGPVTKPVGGEEPQEGPGGVEPVQASPEEEMVKLAREVQQGTTLLAWDVDEDWTSITLYTAQGEFHPKVQGYLDALYPAGLTVDEPALSHLPESTFLGGVATIDPQAAWKAALAAGGDTAADLLAKGKEEILGKDKVKEMDPETLLLPHLGKTYGVGLSNQPLLAPKDAPERAKARMIAIPAVTGFVTYQGKELEANLVKLIEFALVRTGELDSERSRSYAAGSLKNLLVAQSIYREGDKDQNGKPDYAASLMDLMQYELVDWSMSSGQKGYRIQLQRSSKEPEERWMAIASPENGVGVYYAMNQEGKVVHSYKPITLVDTCELPKDAVPYEADLGPAPEGFQAAGEAPVKLEKATIGGKPAYRFAMNEELQRELQGPTGKGISPCFSFDGGVLHMASSEYALGQTLSGKAGSLAKAPRFTRMRARLGEASGSTLAFFHWGGVIDQVLANGEMIVLQGAPTPAELKGPEMPEYPELMQEEGESSEAFMKREREAMQVWQEANEAWSKARREVREKQTEWRKTHAKENRATLDSLLGSLRVLGGAISEAGRKEGLVSSKSVIALDPEAAPSAK